MNMPRLPFNYTFSGKNKLTQMDACEKKTNVNVSYTWYKTLVHTTTLKYAAFGNSIVSKSRPLLQFVK